MGGACFTITIKAEAGELGVKSKDIRDGVKEIIDKWLIQTNPGFRITKVEYDVPWANFLERFNEN